MKNLEKAIILAKAGDYKHAAMFARKQLEEECPVKQSKLFAKTTARSQILENCIQDLESGWREFAELAILDMQLLLELPQKSKRIYFETLDKLMRASLAESEKSYVNHEKKMRPEATFNGLKREYQNAMQKKAIIAGSTAEIFPLLYLELIEWDKIMFSEGETVIGLAHIN